MRWRRREREEREREGERGGGESELERERETESKSKSKQRARKERMARKKSMALDLTTLSANQLTTYTLQDLTQLCPCTTTTNTLSPSYIITSKLTTSQVAQLAS